jgi:hypothetical protein
MTILTAMYPLLPLSPLLSSHGEQELKIQTQRVSRKPEAIYATDESIPKDPDPPAQLHNALSDSAAQNRPPLVIPWTDIR